MDPSIVVFHTKIFSFWEFLTQRYHFRSLVRCRPWGRFFTPDTDVFCGFFHLSCLAFSFAIRKIFFGEKEIH